ncbi:IS30 family transposase [Leisingera sp. F5]|uniref:IS30 family transposase n=1 Tax=Leisingera sp. F5 TaxID=1813816 RepID=UPI000A56D522|nr:IS30 family transposase [Leisingera sp. F5]
MGAVYSQLSIAERRKIERWRHAKVPVNEMARVLGRCRSTVFGELKRNHFSDPCLPKCDGCYGATAQLMAADRRARQRKLIRHPELCRRVVERLKNGRMPEQIGNRMIHEGARLRVCQETIYRYIHSKEGMAQELWWYLPAHRTARRPRRARKRQKAKFHRDASILFRPGAVAHRRQSGHWEADLMLVKQSLGQSSATSMVERVSRFTVLLKNPDKRTKPVMPCPSGDCEAICREGQDHESKQRLASGCPQIHHFRPRHRIRVLAASASTDRYADMVLRPLLSLAKGHG